MLPTTQPVVAQHMLMMTALADTDSVCSTKSTTPMT